MFTAHSTGIGKDRDIITLRRRFRLGISLLVAGAILALVISVTLLWDRGGVILVQADQPDAYIVIDGSVTTTKVGTPVKRLPADKYSVSLHYPGYLPDPPVQTVEVVPGTTVEISFKLIPLPPVPESAESTSDKTTKPVSQQSARESKAASGKKSPSENEIANEQSDILHGTLKVITSPVQGSIFVDDKFLGAGKVTVTDVELGEVIVRFGEVEGYKTPEPQKAFLTQSWPLARIEGVYLPLIYIASRLDQNGRIITQKCQIKQGYVIGNESKYEDAVAGPGIRLLDETETFAWEIGYAFSNRNPPGQDFVEIEFDLPKNFDGNKTLELHLYGAASDRKFPFALSGKSGIDIFVNTKQILENHQPSTNLANSPSLGFDTIQINAFLVTGSNTIRIQASDASRCFYYLQEISLL